MTQEHLSPKHIAIIMDGNGRWAKNQGKNRTEGHKEGAKVVREVTSWCAEKNIPYLTLYAFSTENWKRPKVEVEFLMKLLEKYLKDERDMYLQNQIRFRAIGDLDIFSPRLKNTILELEHITQNHTALTQILALNYGSHDELSRTFLKLHKLLNASLDSEITPLKIKELIESHLDTATLPHVDMLIRTGGEKRLSNFLLWQSSYAELFFSQTLWPDFSSDELNELLVEFLQRQRRFGGIKEK